MSKVFFGENNNNFFVLEVDAIKAIRRSEINDPIRNFLPSQNNIKISHDSVSAQLNQKIEIESVKTIQKTLKKLLSVKFNIIENEFKPFSELTVYNFIIENSDIFGIDKDLTYSEFCKDIRFKDILNDMKNNYGYTIIQKLDQEKGGILYLIPKDNKFLISEYRISDKENWTIEFEGSKKYFIELKKEQLK